LDVAVVQRGVEDGEKSSLVGTLEGVGAPVLIVLFCHPDTHYLCIRVRPVSILLDCDPHNSII
jgi:hypothetical protein